MKKIRLFFLLLLILSLLLALSACGSRREGNYRIIAELDQEEFCVAFRLDDPLCDIITAAMKEVAASGTLSRLCSQYLNLDYSCLDGDADALARLGYVPEMSRTIRVGVQDGIAPLCSSRDDGSYAGLIPDFAELVFNLLGWEIIYMPITSDNVAAELGSGNIDCAWMASSFASSRSSCSLSPGWLKNSHVLIVRSSSKFTRKKSLYGKVLGVTDSTAASALKADGLSEKISSLWYYTNVRSCFNALAAGDCDGMVIDSVISEYYL